MLKLVDLLGIKKENYSDYKIHFAIGSKRKDEPKNEFILGTFEEWQQIQTKKNFNRKYVISLIWVEENKWMFAGVYEVNGEPIKDCNLYKYDLKITGNKKDLVGRVIIAFKKEFRNSYPYLESNPQNGAKPEEMEVTSILESKLSIEEFRGFNQINIDWLTLNAIITNNISSWKSALSNAKGVYLIVDTITGKMYVGSAYGEECIWNRWSDYSIDGHGGNVKLKELLEKNGVDYKKNFKYSILEVCNMNLGSQYIIERESYWKKVLMTESKGLN